MATLTLIGEPFADADAAAHAEATHELTRAVAATAPRGCSARLLIAAEHETPLFSSARVRVEKLPLRAATLPFLWRTSLTARPLDGEFVHALTPLVPLRARGDHDGSQTSVTIPHALGWLAPEAMGASLARQYRSFVKRAVKYADVLVTPTHATATALQERFGGGLAVQVVPVAAPSGYLRPADADARRATLGLPERYLATTATADATGRLQWLFDALLADESLPPLVVLSGSVPCAVAEGENESAGDGAPADTARAGAERSGAAAANGAASGEPAKPSGPRDADAGPAVPEALRHRVRIVRPREVADIGTVLSGATLLALPQALLGAGYEVLGALEANVPVLHADCPVAAELSLDAGVPAPDAAAFAHELSRLIRDDAERARLGVLAGDRSRSFSWTSTAMSLWELHANI
ncbi:mannosyltransferase [Leucobacter weissii]|uniref:Mannosyltransferase n=1 Tax=Leucobacter weissii TaxID=1983706 RepID=A0A939MPA0_9MICO|nr:mannosyltransferase [Leucobacter weissii]MBO1900559.1 mannosyltransferase [Leucobacter weissii]